MAEKKKGKSTRPPVSRGIERMSNKELLEFLLGCETKEEILKHLHHLTPLKYVKFITSILKYVLPKAK